mgnify:CR=1 FL=1
MKLAAVYSVFDSEELLPYSISSIRDLVDEIIIVYQTVSNCGNTHPNESFVSFISELGIDNLVLYQPSITNHPHNAELNERNKRGIGCKQAMNLGCTHFVFVDCYEFYDREQFIQAKKQIIDNDYDSSACQMATYYKSPTYRLTPNEEYYVPFITKLQPGVTQLANFPDYPVLADPSRKSYPWNNFKKFERFELEMHHFTMVRKDIELKFKNHSTLSTRKYSFEQLVSDFNNFKPGDKLVPPFENYNVTVVDNKFNIPEEIPEYVDRSFSVLTEVCNVLGDSNIDYWLSSGTYLSLYRENRFFPWDIDIDIDLNGDTLNEDFFLSVMTKLGLKVHTKKNSNGRLNQIIFTHPNIKRLIDFYVWYKEADRYVADCDVGYLYYPAGMIEDVYPLKIRSSIFICPNPDEYFTLRYGADWRTPKRVSGLPGGGWDITKNLIRK